MCQQCGFLTCATKTKLYKHRRWLEARNFGFRKQRNGTICVANTKALISLAVTAKLICAFVFEYIECWFSHDAAHLFVQSGQIHETLTGYKGIYGCLKNKRY